MGDSKWVIQDLPRQPFSLIVTINLCHSYTIHVNETALYLQIWWDTHRQVTYSLRHFQWKPSSLV